MRHVIQSRRYSYICPVTYFDEPEKSVEQMMEKLAVCCKQFIGTHNFHNYSRDLKANEP